MLRVHNILHTCAHDAAAYDDCCSKSYMQEGASAVINQHVQILDIIAVPARFRYCRAVRGTPIGIGALSEFC